MPDPWAGWMWLRNRWVQDLLADLATGRVPLTHEVLHPLPNWRTVAYLRDLLMACGVLPTVDKQVLHFETWLTHRLAELDGHPYHPTLRRFATWELLPRLRGRARQRPLTPNVRRFTSEQFTAARQVPDLARRTRPHAGHHRRGDTAADTGRGLPHDALCPARRPPAPPGGFRHRRAACARVCATSVRW